MLNRHTELAAVISNDEVGKRFSEDYEEYTHRAAKRARGEEVLWPYPPNTGGSSDDPPPPKPSQAGVTSKAPPLLPERSYYGARSIPAPKKPTKPTGVLSSLDCSEELLDIMDILNAAARAGHGDLCWLSWN